MVDQSSCIGDETGGGASDVVVDFEDLFHGGRDHEGVGKLFLAAEEDTLFGGNADGGISELDGFDCVFDLEQTT